MLGRVHPIGGADGRGRELAAVISSARATLTRLRGLRSPFAASEQAPPLIVHCCHHKVGTLWLTRVLGAVADDFGMRFLAGEQSELGPEVDVFLQDHSRIDTAALRPFRGSHMVRDPRDVVVSAYFYHLQTDEAWCHVPHAEYGGRTYQAHLRSLDRAAGLMTELERCAHTVVRDMVEFREGVEGFHEVRYEDLFREEGATFRRLFEHYGFRPEAVERSVARAQRFSIGRMRGRTVHVRSGRPGQWREHFTPRHEDAFQRLTDDAVRRLGYAERSRGG